MKKITQETRDKLKHTINISINWDEIKSLKNKEIGIVLKEVYLFSPDLKQYVNELAVNNKVTIFSPKMDLYKQILNVKAMNADKKPIEGFKDMKFDYAVCNPPYSFRKHNFLWKDIMDKIIPISEVVTYIGPQGVTGKRNWPNIRKYVTKVEYLPEDTFSANILTVRVHQTREPKTTPIEVYQIDKTNKPIRYLVNRDSFPLRVPLVKMDISDGGEYFDTFDQRGIHWKTLIEGDPSEGGDVSGVWQKAKGIFEYSSNIPKIKNNTNCHYIPCTNPEKGNKLAVRLSKLFAEGKIDGYWNHGFAHATLELDPIREDLVK